MARHNWIHVAGNVPTIADFVVAHFYFNLAKNEKTDKHIEVAVEYCFKRFEHVQKAMTWLSHNDQIKGFLHRRDNYVM